MNNPLHILAVTLTIAGFLALGSMAPAMHAVADESEPELVPEPWVHETHEYDVSGEIDGTPTDEFFVNEKWSIEVRHGDVMTLIMARNITQGGVASVDYTNNIHYDINGKLYIAQFMIVELVFKIGGYGIHAPLTTCTDFSLEYSSIVYDGVVPTFYCNITYEDIRVYSGSTFPAEFGTSTVDLTLIHYIRTDLNNTHIKVEAVFDFSDAVFFDQNNSNYEFPAGEPFTAEIGYMMMVANPEDFRTIGPLIPSSYSDTTLEYNLTLDNGSPLTISKLEMREDFTTFNSTGSSASVGYSSMEVFSGNAHVTHGFPGLVYKDTSSIWSDPEIVIYHDAVTGDNDPGQSVPWALMGAVAAAGAVAAVVAVMLVKKRKARRAG